MGKVFELVPYSIAIPPEKVYVGSRVMFKGSVRNILELARPMKGRYMIIIKNSTAPGTASVVKRFTGEFSLRGGEYFNFVEYYTVEDKFPQGKMYIYFTIQVYSEAEGKWYCDGYVRRYRGQIGEYVQCPEEMRRTCMGIPPIVVDVVAGKPRFRIESIDAPREVEKGKPFNVIVTVKNVGQVAGRNKLEVYLDDTLIHSSMSIYPKSPGAVDRVLIRDVKIDTVGVHTIKVKVYHEEAGAYYGGAF